jgi:hypothetical protein
MEKTLAIVTINSCPLVKAVVNARMYPNGWGVEVWEVSVHCDEQTAYETDPSRAYKHLEGTFWQTDRGGCALPAEIQARINAVLNNGHYNMHSVYGYVSPECIKQFRPGYGQVGRDEEKVTRLRRLAEEKLRKESWRVDWYAIAATLGLKVE